jgi:heme A synthase
MGTIVTIHGMLGESLAIIYLLLAVGSWLRRQKNGLPMWLVGIAHSLIALQVVLGTILYIRAPQVISIWHPITGYLALAALFLTVSAQPFGASQQHGAGGADRRRAGRRQRS